MWLCTCECTHEKHGDDDDDDARRGFRAGLKESKHLSTGKGSYQHVPIRKGKAEKRMQPGEDHVTGAENKVF